MFSGISDDEDLASGTIYVLRSKSDHPTVSENRDVLHKIGVTGGNVEKRIANAKLDPTFLMAEVEVLATSLLDVDKIPAEQFAELYHLRWPIEEKFKQLKFRVNLENWSGKSGLSVLQDVYSRLWATNLMVLMAHPLDSQLDERSSRTQYDYQINWAHAIGCMKRAMVNLFFGSAVQENLERLWVRFLSDLSPIRPNRKYVINHKTYKREFYMCYKFCC